MIAPSRRLDELAGEHQASLPASMRALMKALGASGQGKKSSGAALLSYLLFEPSFVNELINLGMSDTLAMRRRCSAFWLARAGARWDPVRLRRGAQPGFAGSR